MEFGKNLLKVVVGVEAVVIIIGLYLSISDSKPLIFNDDKVFEVGTTYTWSADPAFEADQLYDIDISMKSSNDDDNFAICYAFKNSDDDYECFDDILDYYDSDDGIIDEYDLRSYPRNWVLKYGSTHLITDTDTIAVDFSVKTSTAGQKTVGMIMIFVSIFALMITGCLKCCFCNK